MKIEIVLAGWFLITTHGQENDGTHNYLLEDKVNNTFVAISSDKELPYPLNSWGKFKIDAECEVVTTIEEQQLPMAVYQYTVESKFCNANKFEILKCRRPFIVGGVTYCE